MSEQRVLRLGADAFSDASTSCRGQQVAAIVAEIARVRPHLSWYASDVQTIGPALLERRDPTPDLVGTSETMIRGAAAVEQFESGVFAGVLPECESPRFRTGGLWTEDEESADLGDALVEIRAFDTAYVLIITIDDAIVERLALRFPLPPSA